MQVAMTEGATISSPRPPSRRCPAKPVYLDQVGCPDAQCHGAYRPVARRRPDRGRAGLGRFLARIASGMANDDLLATMVLARDCPLLVAPAMNRQMWENPATQRNIAQLRSDGGNSARPVASRPAARWAPAACWSRKKLSRR